MIYYKQTNIHARFSFSFLLSVLFIAQFPIHWHPLYIPVYYLFFFYRCCKPFVRRIYWPSDPASVGVKVDNPPWAVQLSPLCTCAIGVTLASAAAWKSTVITRVVFPAQSQSRQNKATSVCAVALCVHISHFLLVFYRLMFCYWYLLLSFLLNAITIKHFHHCVKFSLLWSMRF